MSENNFDEKVYRIVDFAEDFAAKYNYNPLIEKLNILDYKYPMSPNVFDHIMESWFNDEPMEERIPTKDELQWIIGLLVSDALFQEDDVYFGNIKVRYIGDLNVVVDLSELDELIDEINS